MYGSRLNVCEYEEKSFVGKALRNQGSRGKIAEFGDCQGCFGAPTTNILSRWHLSYWVLITGRMRRAPMLRMTPNANVTSLAMSVMQAAVVGDDFS